MASSGTLIGSFNGSSGSHFSLRCNWSIVDQDTATRTSKVKLQWAVRKDWSYRTYKNPASWTQVANDESSSGTVNFDIAASLVNSDYVYKTNTVYIEHDLDGTKTASISGTLDLSGTSAGTGSLSGSIVLDAIHVDPPTIDSFTVSDAGTGISTVGAYVATKSRIQLTASATAVETGATIANYAFYANDTLLQSGSSNVYTGINTAVAGSYVFKVIVTDSYGLTAEQSLTAITVLAYTLPTIQTTNTFRCNSSGTADGSGAYVSCTASWTFAAVGTNTANCVASVSGASGTLAQNTPSVIGGSLLPSSAYTVDYVVTDAFGSTASVSNIIYTSFRNLNLYPDNTQGGYAFGEMAVLGKGIHNVDEAIFRGDLTVEGDVSLDNPLPVTSGGTGETSIPNIKAGKDSDGNSFITSEVTSGIVSSSDVTISEQHAIKYGKVAQLTIRVYGTIAAGANANCTVISGWRPFERATGAGYYSQSAFVAQLATDGGLTIRNASATSRTPTSTTPLTISLTYILA